MAKLPLELTTEVLCRLPAKSVARFSCVSKEWSSVFSDPSFSRLHCHRRRQNLKLIVRDGVLYSLDLDSLDCALPLLQDSNFTVKKVLGCSNGLLCLSVYSSDTNPNPVVAEEEIDDDVGRFFCTPEFNSDIIVICDLSTGARRIVPAAPIDFRPEGFKMRMPEALERRFSYGFAFDPSGDDYKLIRISQYVYKEFVDISRPCMLSETKIYSMKTNSWTRIEQDLSKYCISFLNEPALADGSLHWLAALLHDRRHQYRYDLPTLIVVFNLADATFREVPPLTGQRKVVKLEYGGGFRFSNEFDDDRILTLGLGVVGGRIYAMCSHLYSKVVFYRLDGSRYVCSWEPLATFSEGMGKEMDLCLPINFLVCGKFVFSSNGDKVLVEQREGRLICCDLRNETVDDSHINFITMQSKKRRKLDD